MLLKQEYNQVCTYNKRLWSEIQRGVINLREDEEGGLLSFESFSIKISRNSMVLVKDTMVKEGW